MVRSVPRLFVEPNPTLLHARLFLHLSFLARGARFFIGSLTLQVASRNTQAP